MKTKIVMIRHGFSVGNKLNVFAGSSDYPLDELGYKQAELCGKQFQKIRISALYSSPLKRAYDTAVPISKETEYNIIIDNDLRECDGGEWEGVLYDELYKIYPIEYGQWINDIGNAICPGGESVKEFANRVLSVVTKIAKKHKGQTICIVTHATPIRVITAFAKKVPINELSSIEWCGNASINIFDYEDDVFSVVELNNDEYLGELKSVLPSNV